MDFINRQSKADMAAEEWRIAYFGNDGWAWGDDKRVIYEDLIELGEHPHPDDVDAVIGNKSWTRISCDECGENKEYVVVMGKISDYDSNTASICEDCLNKALVLCKKEKQ